MIEPVSFIRIREVIRRCWWYHFIFPRAALCVHARYTLLKRYEDARLTTDSPGPHIIAACLLDTRLKNTRCWLCMLLYYARQTLNQKTMNIEHQLCVYLAHPMCFQRSSGLYINAFICVQYFKYTQFLVAITVRKKICVAIVRRAPRTSSEC